jgi:hypothetical protein
MPSAASRQYGYGVTAHNCVTNLSFHHELAHNMGARHDRYVDSAPTYNHGFVNVNKRKRTVMAYDNQCNAFGFSCTRINWFSGPRTVSGGTLIGNATNNNSRRLNETRGPFSRYTN